jgi:hypothetical protein
MSATKQWEYGCVGETHRRSHWRIHIHQPSKTLSDKLCSFARAKTKIIFFKPKTVEARGTAEEANNYEFPSWFLACQRVIWFRPEEFQPRLPKSAVEFDGDQRRQQDPQRQAGANSCPAALKFRFLMSLQILSRGLWILGWFSFVARGWSQSCTCFPSLGWSSGLSWWGPSFYGC